VYNTKTFGFDADAVAEEFFKKGYIRIYNDGSEQVLEAVRTVVQQVIDRSIQYKDESVKDQAKRFQIIINGNILEIYLAASGFRLTRNSDPKWLINSTYEVGTDFISDDGCKIEAKVYYSDASMMKKVEEANQGNRYIFHGALFVCCYLIDTCKYQWLKCINNVYEKYNNEELDEFTALFLPKQLPLCRCTENKITGEWELTPFYSY
jgi:hypothetical protein